MVCQLSLNKAVKKKAILSNACPCPVKEMDVISRKYEEGNYRAQFHSLFLRLLTIPISHMDLVR